MARQTPRKRQWGNSHVGPSPASSSIWEGWWNGKHTGFEYRLRRITARGFESLTLRQFEDGCRNWQTGSAGNRSRGNSHAGSGPAPSAIFAGLAQTPYCASLVRRISIGGWNPSPGSIVSMHLSSNGRTPAFQAGHAGSTPARCSKLQSVRRRVWYSACLGRRRSQVQILPDRPTWVRSSIGRAWAS